MDWLHKRKMSQEINTFKKTQKLKNTFKNVKLKNYQDDEIRNEWSFKKTSRLETMLLKS